MCMSSFVHPNFATKNIDKCCQLFNIRVDFPSLDNFQFYTITSNNLFVHKGAKGIISYHPFYIHSRESQENQENVRIKYVSRYKNEDCFSRRYLNGSVPNR